MVASVVQWHNTRLLHGRRVLQMVGSGLRIFCQIRRTNSGNVAKDGYRQKTEEARKKTASELHVTEAEDIS